MCHKLPGCAINARHKYTHVSLSEISGGPSESLPTARSRPISQRNLDKSEETADRRRPQGLGKGWISPPLLLLLKCVAGAFWSRHCAPVAVYVHLSREYGTDIPSAAPGTAEERWVESVKGARRRGFGDVLVWDSRETMRGMFPLDPLPLVVRGAKRSGFDPEQCHVN